MHLGDSLAADHAPRLGFREGGWRGRRVRQELLDESTRRVEKIITTSLVLAESHALLELRLGWAVAERFWERLRRGRVGVEAVVAADLEVAWSIGRRYGDRELSLVDRSSFAVMERLGLTRVASFDQHFAVQRFGRNRDKAFEIVR